MSDVTIKNGIQYTQAKLVDSATGKTITKEMPVSVLANFKKNSDGSYTVQHSEGNNNTVKTTENKTFSLQESKLTDAEKDYLINQGLISSNGDECKILKGDINSIKAALNEYNRQSTGTEGFTKGETITKDLGEDLGKNAEESALLKGKVDVTTYTKDYNFDVKTTTTTETSYGAPTQEQLDKADLNKRSDRKELKEQYRQSLEKWLDNPANTQTMEDSLAAKKYSKKIDKEIKKLDKEYDKPDKLVKAFFEDGKLPGATAEMKQNYNYFLQMADEILTKSDDEYMELIVKGSTADATDADKLKARQAENALELRDQICKDSGVKLENIVSSKTVRTNAIRAYYAQTLGNDIINGLKTEIAKDKVLNSRSEAQKASDKKYFLDYMSKREVRDKQAEQNIENTTLYLTKKEAKEAEKQNKKWGKQGDPRYNPKAQFNFVGKAGLAKIQNRPDLFCKEADQNDYDYEFEGKYYKFDSETYSNKIQEIYGNHATLSEVRNFAGENGNKIFIDKDGNNTTFEEFLGGAGSKKNGRIGYRENRRERNAIKATGITVDKDYSNQLKLANGAGKGVIGAGIGVISMGLGILVGGPISGIAEGATQTFTHKGQEIYIDPKTQDCVTKFEINGRTYTVRQKHTTEGFTAKGDTQIFTEDGQKVEYRNANLGNALKAAGPAALIGTIVGIATSKVRSKGDTDDVVDLTPPATQQVTREAANFQTTKTKMTKTFHDITGDGTVNSSYNNETAVGVKNLYAAQGSNAEDRDLTKMDTRKVARDITNDAQLAAVNKNKAQAVFANNAGHKLDVTPSYENGVANYAKPQEVTIYDNTNGKLHKFTYKLLDTAQAQKDYPTLANEAGPFYQLISVTDENGNSVANKDNKVEIKTLKEPHITTQTKTITTQNGEEVEVKFNQYEYDFWQDKNHPGSNHSSINNKKAGPKHWTK